MKIADLPPVKGNYHSYNHKVIWISIFKSQQGSYRWQLGIQCYPLPKNVDYSWCIELMDLDYTLWPKTQIIIEKNSPGVTIH